MRRMYKKGCAAVLSAAAVLSILSGCSGGLVNDVNDGTVNTDLSQTEFNIMGGMSALCAGYDNHDVLDPLLEEAGIKIK